MRTVTVDELEALATQTAKIASDIAPLHTSCYDGDDSLTAAYDTCLKASAKFQETIYHMQRSLASARSDAEADKADAKRKDV